MYSVQYSKYGDGLVEIEWGNLAQAEKHYTLVLHKLKAWNQGGWVRILQYSNFEDHPTIICGRTVF